MFGKEIKQIRVDRNLTQTELAKATGLPQNTISWIEQDKGNANEVDDRVTAGKCVSVLQRSIFQSVVVAP